MSATFSVMHTWPSMFLFYLILILWFYTVNKVPWPYWMKFSYLNWDGNPLISLLKPEDLPTHNTGWHIKISHRQQRAFCWRHPTLLLVYSAPAFGSASLLSSHYPAPKNMPLHGDLLSFVVFTLHLASTVHWAMLCAQLCLALCNPTNCSLPGSSVHEIFQANLEQAAISFSRDTSPSRDQTRISCVSWIGQRMFYHLATWEAILAD